MRLFKLIKKANNPLTPSLETGRSGCIMAHNGPNVGWVDQTSAVHVRSALEIEIEFFEALSNGDIATAADVFSADGELLFPGLRPVRGKALIRRMLGIIRRRYETIAWRSSRAPIRTDDWIVLSWEVNGIFRESALDYVNEGVSIIRLDKAGKIEMLSDYFKDTGTFFPTTVTSAGRELRTA